MTTKQEYAESADYEEWLASIGLKSDPAKRTHALAARVLRQLAEGAVLCETDYSGDYHPIDAEQP